MEKRKLQATGGASLTLTLPKSWVDECGLESKDEVLVIPKGKSLEIKPLSLQPVEDKVNINIDGLTEAWLIRELVAAYISGADKIIFRSKNISLIQRQSIQKAVQLLFGFEILEETSKKIYVKNIFDDSKLSIPQSTQKIFFITRTMFQDALKAVQSGDENLATAISQRDFEVNKLLYGVKRQFNSLLKGKTEGSINEINYYVNVAVQLERIADHAVQIANTTDEASLQGSAYKNFPAIESRVSELFDDAEKVVKSLDKTLAHKILDEDSILKRLITDSGQAEQSLSGVLVQNSLDRLRGYIMNIAELTIDYSFAHDAKI
jgi:phosphate uptake regulator